MSGPKVNTSVLRDFRIEDPVEAAAEILQTFPEGSDDEHRHPDGRLIDCAWRLVELEQLRACLFNDGEPRDAEREHAAFIDLIDTAAEPFANYVCDCQAKTMSGHRARAAALLAMDQTGLMVRAAFRDVFGEQLLASLIIDLLVSQTP